MESSRRGAAREGRKRLVLAGAAGCYCLILVYFFAYVATVNNQESLVGILLWHQILLQKILSLVGSGLHSYSDQEPLAGFTLALSIVLGLLVYGAIAYRLMARRRSHRM